MAGRETRQAFELVLGQGLGRKEIERGRTGIGEQTLQHRHVIAQALAAGGAGDDHGIEATAERLDGLHLVGVEARKPARAKGFGE